MPDGLYGGYTFSSSTDTKTNTTTGFTGSFSAKETIQEKITAGDCDIGDCPSAGIKFSAQQALEGSKDTLMGSYSDSSQNLNVTTGFSDLVSYQNEALTIYLYPVIGQTVCPSDKPNCAGSEKVPLIINMAGPDTLSYKEAQAGIVLPWYQPPWIPGNILSYPGNLQQLQAAAFRNPSDFQQPSQAVTWLIGSGGTANASVTWTGGGSAGSTSSFKQNYSFETDFSYTVKWGLEDELTSDFGAELDLSGSFGFSNLTDSLKTLSATRGIEFTRTAPLEDVNYSYSITPHIFSKVQPPTVVDDTTLPAQVQTFGALRTGYEVDISSTVGGGFWRAWYGKAPDVALNQPAHWTISIKVNDPGDGSCRLFDRGSSDFNCVTLGDRLPPALGEPIWLSAFHWMRGLFITGPSGQGPQLATATTGDQLTLQARVYNLSLASLPPGAEVRVRFMGMPWDTTQNIPAAPSFQIGEQVIAGEQLPPFNSDTGHPNWTLVPQRFDTSGTNCGGQSCDNQDLAFWMVVWIENANGTLGSELPQHGLTSIPAAEEDFLAVAAREQPYSNNLGFYNQVFHIFPRTQPPQAPSPRKGEMGAQITRVGAAHRTLRPGQSTALAAKVRTGGRDLGGGLEVAFYDGDPIGDGKLIGLQQLPRLRANSTYDFRVLFTPQECGRRTVFVVAGREGKIRATSTRRNCNRSS